MRARIDTRREFAWQLNALLDRCGASARVVRQLAKANGIGYSTLQSWRTGRHLLRVPDDNPCFRGFVEAIASSPADTAATMAVATAAWREYVSGKRANVRRRAAAT